jgi:hypothetical protein
MLYRILFGGTFYNQAGRQAEIGHLGNLDRGDDGYDKLKCESIQLTFQLLSTIGGTTTMHDFWGYFVCHTFSTKTHPQDPP